MRYLTIFYLFLIPGFCMKAQGLENPVISTTVSFQTEDSIWVFGDYYQPIDADELTPVLLLLHQSASNSNEYLPMIPSFLKWGFACLAIDARGGGQNYGRHNRTNANLPHHGGGPQAYYDFKAALGWLNSVSSGKITIIGSSYSAGRMFAVLMEKPQNVVAAAAFSPGRGFARPMHGASLSWSEQVELPVFVTWSPEEMNAETQQRFETIKSKTKTLFTQEHGVHAASTLRPDRNPLGHQQNMEGLKQFLMRYSR